MQKMNRGFTLAEVLCVLVIIGVCIVVAMTTVEPADKKVTKYLYMNAFSSLQKAYYNSSSKGFNPFASEYENTPIVHEENRDTGTLVLCWGLTSFINTTTNTRTASTDFSSSCSATKLTDPKADSFDENNVQFVATNGMKFYITKQLGSEEDDLLFYLVFVDVNGERRPNSIVDTYKWTARGAAERSEHNRIMPDIFAFAVLDTGRICPIGVPEYDSSILTARLAYFDESGNPAYTNTSLAYYQAKGAAWGYYNEGGPNPVTGYNKDEEFSVNDAIRHWLAENVSDCKITADFPTLSSSPMSPHSIQSESPFNCSIGDFESCYIFLDQYR